MPPEVAVVRAVIGLTHRPCGACGQLVWIPEGCEHLRIGRIPLRNREHQRAARERARAEVAAFFRGLPR